MHWILIGVAIGIGLMLTPAFLTIAFYLMVIALCAAPLIVVLVLAHYAPATLLFAAPPIILLGLLVEYLANKKATIASRPTK